MNQQDQSFIVEYQDEHQKSHRGTLKVQHTNGNVTFSFYPVERPPFPSTADNVCNLSDFTVFELFNTPPLKICFSGSDTTNHFCFTKEEDKSRFIDFIGSKVRVIRSDLNPSLFLLESIDFGPSECSTIVLPNTNSSNQPIRISLDRYKQWTCKKDQLTREELTITKDNFNDNQGEKLFNANIDDEVIFDAFKSLLTRPPTENDATYDMIKKQWKSVIPRQFANNKNLQSLIKRLETDLQNHAQLFEKYNTNSKQVMKIAFNILLSYSIYNWDGALYYDNLVELLMPFIDAYLLQHKLQENNEEFNHQMESEIFTLFDVFYDENKFSELSKPTIKSFVREILEALKIKLLKHFESLNTLLGQKQDHSLDFLKKDISWWFIHVFSSNETKDIQRLWISILSFDGGKKVSLFFQSFVLALLFYVAPQLNELNPLSYEEFVQRFNEIKNDVDLRTLLDNTFEIYNTIKE